MLGVDTETPEGKIIVVAIGDPCNNMVKALRNDKAQNVQGGLGAKVIDCRLAIN